jgi:hypothetical protein
VPAEGLEAAAGARVAALVAGEFGEPVPAAGGGDAACAAIVHVPEAAMDVDDFFELGENDIGSAGEIAAVEAETIAKLMDELPNNQFRLSVARLDGGHHSGALGFGNVVCRRFGPLFNDYANSRRSDFSNPSLVVKLKKFV